MNALGENGVVLAPSNLSLNVGFGGLGDLISIEPEFPYGKVESVSFYPRGEKDARVTHSCPENVTFEIGERRYNVRFEHPDAKEKR